MATSGHAASLSSHQGVMQYVSRQLEHMSAPGRCVVASCPDPISISSAASRAAAASQAVRCHSRPCRSFGHAIKQASTQCRLSPTRHRRVPMHLFQ